MLPGRYPLKTGRQQQFTVLDGTAHIDALGFDPDSFNHTGLQPVGTTLIGRKDIDRPQAAAPLGKSGRRHPEPVGSDGGFHRQADDLTGGDRLARLEVKDSRHRPGLSVHNGG